MNEHKKIFKEAAKERFEEAKILYQNGKAHIAFYLLGYCVECSAKYFIIKSLGCDYIDEVKPKVGKLYWHIDDIEQNREPILYRKIKLTISQIRKKYPRIPRIDKNFYHISQNLPLLIKEFYGTYGWRTQLRYSSEYSFNHNNYPPGYNFDYIKDNLQIIIRKVGGIICHL